MPVTIRNYSSNSVDVYSTNEPATGIGGLNTTVQAKQVVTINDTTLYLTIKGQEGNVMLSKVRVPDVDIQIGISKYGVPYGGGKCSMEELLYKE